MEVLGPILRNCPQPLPDSIKDWLLDLHYCGNIVRRASSQDIKKWVVTVRSTIVNYRQFIEDELKNWGFADAELLCADWLTALTRMEALAGGKAECEWTRSGHDDPEATAKMMAFLEKHAPKENG